jgi:hypothetical protein
MPYINSGQARKQRNAEKDTRSKNKNKDQSGTPQTVSSEPTGEDVEEDDYDGYEDQQALDEFWENYEWDDEIGDGDGENEWESGW